MDESPFLAESVELEVALRWWQDTFQQHLQRCRLASKAALGADGN